MGLLIRTLLVWLLAVAVPAQGAAHTTMAVCNAHGTATHTLRDAGAAGHLSGHAHVQDPVHRAAAPAVLAHLALDATAAGAQWPAPASQHALVVGAHGDTHKCSACASCCSFGLLPSAPEPPPLAEAAATVFAEVVSHVEAVAPDGPERPPRVDLA